jgi:hypothetical protein
LVCIFSCFYGFCLVPSILSDVAPYGGGSSFIDDEVFVSEDHPAVGRHQFDPTSDYDIRVRGGEVAFSQMFSQPDQDLSSHGKVINSFLFCLFWLQN